MAASISGGPKLSQWPISLARATLSSLMPLQAELIEHARRRGPARPAGRPGARRRAGPPSTSAPPPVRASNGPSGPTANGNRVATSRKKISGSRRRAAGRRQAQLAKDQARSSERHRSARRRGASGWWLAARIAPPAARCAAIAASSRSSPSASRPLAGLVEQPERRAAGDHPGQRGALALAGREHPHRHVGERRQPHRRHARPPASAGPEGRARRRARCRSSSARCSSASAASARSTVPAAGRSRPGGEPEQGGFAGAVRPA